MSIKNSCPRITRDPFPRVHKWGINASSGAGGEETIWSGSTAYKTTPGYLAGDTALEIISTAADTMDVTITGNTAAGVETIQTLTLTGAVKLPIPVDLKRVYRISLAKGTINAGTITIVDQATSAIVYARVEIGVGQTQMAIYSVPATTATGETVLGGEVIWAAIDERSANGSTCRLLANGIEKDHFIIAAEGQVRHDYGTADVVDSGIGVDVGDDLELVVTGSGGGSNVNGRFRVRLFI